MSHTYEQFRSDLYFAYDCLGKYLSEKYELTIEDYESYTSEYYEGSYYQESIFSKDLIDSFIERVSSVNIKEYIDKIRNAKGNVKP